MIYYAIIPGGKREIYPNMCLSKPINLVCNRKTTYKPFITTYVLVLQGFRKIAKSDY